MKILFPLTLALLLPSGCFAQRANSYATDPNYITEYANQPGFQDTSGHTLRSFAINTSLKTLILICAGQSNSINISPGTFAITTPANIDNLNIYDGLLYSPLSKALGTQDAGNGAVVMAVADKLVTSPRFDRVIVAPIGVSGTPIIAWTTNELVGRIATVMTRLKVRGIVPGGAGLTFAFLWMQGEADKSVSATQVYYYNQLLLLKANLLASGFVGKIFIPTETFSNNTLTGGTGVAAAQAQIRDGITVYDGGNLDSLTGTNRQADNTHFSDTGTAAAANLIYNAMLAAGY